MKRERGGYALLSELSHLLLLAREDLLQEVEREESIIHELDGEVKQGLRDLLLLESQGMERSTSCDW